MARVYIDPHMFSSAWFGEALTEMIQSRQVQFVYCHCAPVETEASKVRKALEFYQRIGQMKDRNGGRLRADVPADLFQNHLLRVQSNGTYCNEQNCDDAHIFALAYIKNVSYVFSMDHRLARCRDALNRIIHRRYCSFAVLSNDNVYDVHKPQILR